MEKRMYLNLDNAIIIHDVKQIKKEPAQSKIKTKNKLSKIIAKKNPNLGSDISVYHKMVRYEKGGFSSPKTNGLVIALLDYLEVSEEELIIE